MSATTRLFSASRAAAMSLALGLALASTAMAQQPASAYPVGKDASSSSIREGAIRDAARSKPAAAFTAEQLKTLNDQFKVGRSDAFGDASAPQPLQATGDYRSRVVSTAPAVGGAPDLVGAHGPQDALANQIYAPGSHPAGW